MKKIILIFGFAFLMTSCIVVKVYETPTDEQKEPKLLREKRRFISSEMTVPVPTEGTEILFIGDDHPPVPMPLDENHFTFKSDTTAQKEMVIIRLDSDKDEDMRWVSSSKGHVGVASFKAGDSMDIMKHKTPRMMFIAKESPSMMECDHDMSSDSLAMKACCAEKAPMKKRIRVMKIDASETQAGENTFIMKSSDGKDPLIVIDGEIQDMAVMKDLSPDKIETIDVLKGESAAKEFGEKGANGVIKIRLKKE